MEVILCIESSVGVVVVDIELGVSRRREGNIALSCFGEGMAKPFRSDQCAISIDSNGEYRKK